MLARRLKKGDIIGIVSPSAPVGNDLRPQVDAGVKVLNKMGFEVKFAKNAFANSLGYSATAEEKAADINEMFADPKIAAIICSQGGENANSVLPLLDYSLIKKNPKIFLGISDITVLLDGIYAKTGLITFHGNDIIWGFGRNPDKYDIDEFINRLELAEKGMVKKNSEWKKIRAGVTEGKLLGGNLHCLMKLTGTEFAPDYTDSILFVEDYGEEHGADVASFEFHHLDQAGVLKKIKGMIIGYYKTASGANIENIANEVISKYDFPVIKCNDFGHNTPNTTLPVGILVKLNADNVSLEILEDFLI